MKKVKIFFTCSSVVCFCKMFVCSKRVMFSMKINDNFIRVLPFRSNLPLGIRVSKILERTMFDEI